MLVIVVLCLGFFSELYVLTFYIKTNQHDSCRNSY
jgi:hypothetical protein